LQRFSPQSKERPKRVYRATQRDYATGAEWRLHTKEHCESSAFLFGNEAHLRCMKNEARLCPMKRAFGSRRSNIALRFMRAKIAKQFASASRCRAPLHIGASRCFIQNVFNCNRVIKEVFMMASFLYRLTFQMAKYIIQVRLVIKQIFQTREP